MAKAIDHYRSGDVAWGTVPVGAKCQVVNGFPFPSQDFKPEGQTPVIRVRDIRSTRFTTFLSYRPNEAWLVRPGDIVIGMDGDFNAVEWRRGPAALNQRVCLIRCSDTSFQRFLGYALQNTLNSINAQMDASTVKHLASSDVLKAHVPYPDVHDRTLIVRYLDHAEMRIAKAIAGKSRLVALLAERRSAIEAELLLGSQASADSTTWFGELPDGWTRLPARALCDERNERNRNDLPLLSVTIRRGVVSQQDYFSSAGSKKDQSRSDKSQYKAVQPGDVVYNKMRAWQGAAGCSALEGIVSPAYVVVRPRELIVPEFLGRVMRTPQFAKEAERWSYGINSDMWSLRPHHFKLIEFPVPPLDTQIRLLAQVVERTSAIEKALVAVENEIALLKEYRVRLISDVVTGKLDVRAEAASLKDVDPSELAAVLAGGATSTDEEEGADGDE
jgi:restriction endonuclease S subunit